MEQYLLMGKQVLVKLIQWRVVRQNNRKEVLSQELFNMLSLQLKVNFNLFRNSWSKLYGSSLYVRTLQLINC
jgi:hypothetical protein